MQEAKKHMQRRQNNYFYNLYIYMNKVIIVSILILFLLILYVYNNSSSVSDNSNTYDIHVFGSTVMIKDILTLLWTGDVNGTDFK